MMGEKTPIESMLDSLEWTQLPPPEGDPLDVAEGPPYATHEGVLVILGKSLHCYQLSDGQRVIDAGDFETFFNSEPG